MDSYYKMHKLISYYCNWISNLKKTRLLWSGFTPNRWLKTHSRSYPLHCFSTIRFTWIMLFLKLSTKFRAMWLTNYLPVRCHSKSFISFSFKPPPLKVGKNRQSNANRNRHPTVPNSSDQTLPLPCIKRPRREFEKESNMKPAESPKAGEQQPQVYVNLQATDGHHCRHINSHVHCSVGCCQKELTSEESQIIKCSSR